MSSRPGSGHSTPSGRPATRRWAIVTRLATAYAAASVIVLAAAGVFLYDGLRSGLEEEDHALIAGKVRLLRLILADEPQQPGGLRAELRLESGVRRFNPYFARVIDSAGTIDDETPGMREVLPPNVFPEPIPSHEDPTRGQYWTATDGRVFLLIAAEIRPARATGPSRSVQAAIDVSEEFKLLAAYRRRLAATLGIGLLFSVFAGVVIARRGLRPIRLMTDTVRHITPRRLYQRVGSAGWPAELAGLAAAFDEMLERLEESFERLGRFSDDIAHELRTPINNILGQTEVALGRARSSAASRQVLESNLEEIRRIVALIDGLLFLSRAEHAVTALRRTSFDVRPVLESIAELYGPIAEEQGVRIRCDGGGQLVADENLFRQVVSNLTSNALAFVGTGGSVMLSAAKAPDGSLKVRVRDTGIGIAEEHLPRIFNRFYRVPNLGTDSRDGSGLGLAIAKSIMELHGGTIGVESREGHGATFELIFPGEK